jgi:oxygen-independent coproporphyrinogen III oxidase
MFLSAYSELPIYVHVPFCRKKCDYCDFFSIPGSSAELQSRVVEQILLQLETLLDTLRPQAVPSLYIGGGTPNSLSPPLFERLITGINRSVEPYVWHSDFEWTVELNPELISAEQLDFLAKSPVNRLSIGTQSFSESALQSIGRNAGLSKTISGLELVQKWWQQRWSLDLITGLPQQSREEALQELDTAFSFSPGHISLYTLSVEKNTPLERRVLSGEIKTSSDDQVADILVQLWSVLHENGFQHYEVSNFAQPQQTSRHNWYYWRLKPYLGIGPAAVSTLPAAKGLPIRAQTPASISEFLTRKLVSGPPFASLATEKLTPNQFLLEYLMMGLRTIPGIEVEECAQIFNHDIREVLEHTLDRSLESGLLRLHTIDKRSYLSITEPGMLLLDHILVQAAEEISGLQPELNWPLT